ncbi:pyridoxamine 5'-phosphate oxidase family protein [Nodosilinea sp. LEGE 07088]|uniref:pyridoxamine 5'-phosphate oxidase family protein n=1 Tax=Nodosilinea sp. LEGE 07088 TaxID=2777968 RepID=UPI00187F3064|nr:pyridoxamine 5'-phosphate oxidase family protein [Nodosilinea sp. LEGE 07088]MBE9138033.1 pyridoxamine 5'-phosphate oxidase family protein [Nodosilinea sp. LEGE 07088]
MSIATAENGWINTTDGQNPEVITRARQILDSTIYGTLSTSSPDGMPWASPVIFTYDSDWNLYWSSAMVAQHSKNLYANQGRAAIAIYSTDREEGKGQGLYLSGTVAEVEPENVGRVISLLQKRAAKGQQRSPADYLAPSPRRLYRFQPQTAWITGEHLALSETILIDTKIQLDLASLVVNP